MPSAFGALCIDDRLAIDGIEYRVAGMMALREPADGPDDAWQEWLLVPGAVRPADAIAAQRHRWLSYETGSGVILWSPIDLPNGCTPETLGREQRFRHGGRDYAVDERYRMVVDSVAGDVGDDATRGESFDAVDLKSGTRRLSVEWNERGVDATLGMRIGDHDLIGWSNAADGKLSARNRALGDSRGGALRFGAQENVGDGTSWNWISAVAIAGFAGLVILLDRCDDDCRQQQNPATGRYETVCDDGMHSHRGRSFGSWGGK